MLDSQANKKHEAKKASGRKRGGCGHERRDSQSQGEEGEGGAVKRRKVMKRDREKIDHSEKIDESANDEMKKMEGIHR